MVQVNFDPEEEWPEFYYPIAIDAGIVPEQPSEEFTIERGAWLEASAEELSWLHDVLLYTNQEANVQHRLSGDVVVRIRYSTPCITSLGRAA